MGLKLSWQPKLGLARSDRLNDRSYSKSIYEAEGPGPVLLYGPGPRLALYTVMNATPTFL